MLLIAVLLPSFSVGQQEISRPTTVCELLAHPDAWNHQLVKITGFASNGFEDSGIFDPACPKSRYIWMEYGGKLATGTKSTATSGERTRPKQIVVEGISVPLLEDDRFRKFDFRLHQGSSGLVRATLVVRFFAGRKEKIPGGTTWGGYGHLGCCSLAVLTKILSVDDRSSEGFDSNNVPHEPPGTPATCFRPLEKFDVSFLLQQHQAEAGELAYAFDDPQRVAVEALRSDLDRIKYGLPNTQNVSGYRLTIVEDSAARKIYNAAILGVTGKFWIVVSRPYLLSFYAAKPGRVAWVSVAETDVGCSTSPGES